MEAALALQIPLSAYVRFQGDRVFLDAFEVTDPTAARMLRDAEDPGRLVADMLEIGARVLDREHTGADVEFVKAEFERAARSLDAEFVERARKVAERLDQKVDEVFGPENGHVTKVLQRHFGDESSVAVQHRVQAVVQEVAAKMREDLRRQFASDSETNPLAGFQRASLAVMKQSSDQQAERLAAMTSELTALKVQLAELRAEKEKRGEVAAAEERGAAKGRTYEEAVFEALDAIAVARGDDCDAVGDTRGEGGRKGDVVVAIDACAGPARGRVVFEAKDRKLSKNQALEELDAAMQTRGADYAVLVVPSEDELPARTHPLREYNGDKLFVVYDPEDGSRLALEVAYGLARARVLMARDDAGGLDATAARAEVERALQAMEDVRRIKSQLTNASNGIEQARSILDAMAGNVRAHLAQLDALLTIEAPDEAE
ncbi:MAG TPA: DUF2130 domain-containing protein [Capillimicrobium sp.]|nr:DUF2130 domain-containing protein [Capillimicrobium sp.]